MAHWDVATDFLVVGSGAGAMTAAIVARKEGLDPLVVEKTEFYGGSSARSGGGIWIPNHPLMAKEGLHDSLDDARAYLDATVGDRVPAARKEAFLTKGPEMIAFLLRASRLHLEVNREYTDYYPERPGARSGGRSLDPGIFRGRKLGRLLRQLRPPPYELPVGLVITPAEFRNLALVARQIRSLPTAAKVVLRTLWGRITRARLLCMGQALVAPLRLSLAELGVPLWLNTRVRQLVVEGERVAGALAERHGRPIRIRAARGVVLASGGFARSQELREHYQRPPARTEWTLASPGDTGDAIRMGIEVGAAVDLMDEAWWGPSSLPPGAAPHFHLVERSSPGSILVDSDGRRFTNEAAPYVDVVHAMAANDRPGKPSIPAWFIMDRTFRRRYLFGVTLPGQPFPDEYLESGYVTKADSLEALAGAIGVDRHGLLDTVARFNEFARAGKDLDFHRGESAYDRYYGDPTVRPNPCLAPIETPPFYAVAMISGDIGTKGGLLTDEHARVLREDGSPIGGLYAIGNASASVMGDTYPGPGATLAPAMTFGYVAALHAARSGAGASPGKDWGRSSA